MNELQKEICRLNDIEHELNVYDEKVCAVSLWRLVRIVELDSILQRKGLFDRRRYSLSLKRRAIDGLKSLAISMLHIFKLKRKDFLFITFPRREYSQEGYVDKFTDPLMDEIGRESCLCIEKPFMSKHYEPSYKKDALYYDLFYYAGYVISYLIAPILFLIGHKSIFRLTKKVCGPLSYKNKNRMARTLTKAISRLCISTVLARVTLFIVRPKCIFLVNRWNNIEFIIAAKKNNIKVIELQHGAIAGKTVPYSSCYDYLLDPDRFYAFGDYWLTREFGLPRKLILPIGYKYLKDRALLLRQKANLSNSHKKIVLVVTQPENNFFRQHLNEFMEYYPDYIFRLKFHPQEAGAWEKRYGHLLKYQNFEVIEDAKISLYEEICSSNIVMGISTTVLYEASFLGVKVALVNFENFNFCPALEFIGKYGFYELKKISDLSVAMDDKSIHFSGVGNPFFKWFDREKFFSELECSIS